MEKVDTALASVIVLAGLAALISKRAQTIEAIDAVTNKLVELLQAAMSAEK